MKVSEIKRALKTATAKVYVSRASLHTCLNASVSIMVPSKYEGGHDETLLSFKAQANDRTVSDPYSSRELDDAERARPTPNTYLHLYKVSGFYAVEIECAVRLWGHSGHKTDPETAQNFFKVVEGVIETYNLRHKYPECDVSQILAALELLGAHVEPREIEGTDFHDWNQARVRRDSKE